MYSVSNSGHNGEIEYVGMFTISRRFSVSNELRFGTESCKYSNSYELNRRPTVNFRAEPTTMCRMVESKYTVGRRAPN